MSGGWVTMPLNGWTMLAQEEVRAMTTTTGTDLAPRLRAFKHRLDPNPAQATLLAQYAGAARVAYNMLTAHNRAALAAGAARRTELAETGLAGPELAARYAGADALVHVSWTEGVPQVLLEAFAAGLPVVATAVGGVPAAVVAELGALIRGSITRAA